MKSSCFSEFWQKISNTTNRRKAFRENVQRVLASKDHVLSLFHDTDKAQAERIFDESIKYLQKRSFLGKDILRFFSITDPRLKFKLFSLLAGIDLEHKIQQIDDVWMFDGIKLPHLKSHIHGGAWDTELADIVFSAFLRRHIDNFDHCCSIAANYLQAVDFQEGPYERGNVCLEQGDIVFDCGANIGMFSAVASRYGAEKVYAFEAIPDLVEDYVTKTAEINGNIQVVNAAVWNKEEVLNFSLFSNHIGASRVEQLLSNSSTKKETLTYFPVQATTLDAFAEKNNINRIDFIKADIEGAERNMLRGAKHILREFAPKLSICTYHLPDDPQVLREIILDTNPQYQIVEKYQKMYAHVPK